MNTIYALDVTSRRLHVFSSEAEVKQNCEGLSIVEGDWLFYAADGSPLEVHFSVPARIFPEKNTYTNGEYSLRPAHGERLELKLQHVEFVDGHAVFKDVLYEQKLEIEQSA